MNFSVSIDCSCGGIAAQIDGDLPSDTEYFFYLIKDGQVVSRHGWLKSPRISWKNLAPGRYQVRGFCQQGGTKVAKFSNALIFHDSDFDTKWENLSFGKKEIPKLLYSPSPFPHQDILVIQSCNPQRTIIPGFFLRRI
jgi:hypothetical protein